MLKYTYLTLVLLCLFSSILAQKVTTIASSSSIDDALILDQEGHLYGSNYQGSSIFKISPEDWSVETFSSNFNTPNGLALHKDGNIYMADNQGNKIYKVAPDGTASTFISSFINPSGLIFELDSDTLIATSYNGNRIVKIAPDRTETVLSQGGILNGPVGLCYDDDGNLYVGNFNNRQIIRIDEDGGQHLIAQAPGNGWMGFINYAKGYIYGTLFNQHKIYRTDLDGNGEIILGSTIGSSDGDASSAKFSSPNGIAVSPSQDTIYISDYNTFNIRMITNLTPATNIKEHKRVDFFKWQLYPNPAATTLNFNLNLEKSSNVTAKLFNNQGQLIEQLLTQQSLNSGEHNIPLTIDSFPSGTYYVQLEIDEKYTFSKAFIKS